MDQPVNISSVIGIPCTKDNFITYWLTFLTPLHKLTPKVIDIAACIIRHRFELSKVITDTRVLDKYLMSSEIREKILQECNITLPNFHVAIGKLKKAKFFINGTVNEKFIPKYKEENGVYNLLLHFTIND